MFNHYYTLKLVAEKLHQDFAGANIEEIFTQEKNEAIFICKKSGNVLTLQFSCDGRMFHLLKRDSFHRAKKNSLDIFSSAIGNTIESINILEHDRCIRIALENGNYFYALLIPAKSNLLLYDNRGKMIERFKQSSSEPQFRNEPVHENLSLENFFRIAHENSGITITDFLKKCFPKLGATLLQELIVRSGLIDVSMLSAIQDEQVNDILQTFRQLRIELEKPIARIYFRDNYPEKFSIIQLQSCRELREEIYDDVCKALHDYLRFSLSGNNFNSLKNRITQALEKEIHKLVLSLSKMDSVQTLEQRSELYEKHGSLLMTVLYESPQQPNQFSIKDIFSEHDLIIDIPLQPKLSILENAQRYFEKSKQCKAAITHSKKFRISTEQKLISIKNARTEADNCLDYSSLKHYISSNKKMLRSIGINERGEKETKPFPFRRFKITGGFEVWAGKNNVNNDELTLHGADKNDLWFHARDIGGSHVVLKVNSAAGDVSKEVISQAASIAAYYSKHRKAKSVAVAYTQKKYVRKPKGVPSGTVYIEKEKVILVDPKLPPQEEVV